MWLGVSNQDARNDNLFLYSTIDDLCVILFIQHLLILITTPPRLLMALKYNLRVLLSTYKQVVQKSDQLRRILSISM